MSSPLDYANRGWLKALVVGVLVFLYAPILAMMAFSFNDSKRTIIWEGFSLQPYEDLLKQEALIESLGNSLLIAAITTVLATLIGTMLAIALWRFTFRLKPVLEALNGLPIVIPEICLGVAMMIFFTSINWPTTLPWPLNLSSIIIAHTAFCFPFVTLVVRARLAGFDRSLEEAAFDLGANTWQVYRDVVIPYLKPGLIAGGLLAMTLSLDDFVITFFTSNPDTLTFPVKIYSQIRMSVRPYINAASTILILVTAAIIVLAAWYYQRSKAKP
jgi:spermidine/putrescine transport system permease protein